jgi:hypothetical protein
MLTFDRIRCFRLLGKKNERNGISQNYHTYKTDTDIQVSAPVFR